MSSKTVDPAEVLQQLPRDGLCLLYLHDHKDEDYKSIKTLKTQQLQTTIMHNIMRAGTKLIGEELPVPALQCLLEGFDLDVNKKKNNPNSKPVLKKRLQENLERLGLSAFLDQQCNVEVMQDLCKFYEIKTASSDKDELIELFVTRIKHLGFESYLESLPDYDLREVCIHMDLLQDDEHATRKKYIEGILQNSAIKGKPKTKPRAKKENKENEPNNKSSKSSSSTKKKETTKKEGKKQKNEEDEESEPSEKSRKTERPKRAAASKKTTDKKEQDKEHAPKGRKPKAIVVPSESESDKEEENDEEIKEAARNAAKKKEEEKQRKAAEKEAEKKKKKEEEKDRKEAEKRRKEAEKAKKEAERQKKEEEKLQKEAAKKKKEEAAEEAEDEEESEGEVEAEEPARDKATQKEEVTQTKKNKEKKDDSEYDMDNIDLENLREYPKRLLRKYCEEEGLTVGKGKNRFIDAILQYNEEDNDDEEEEL